MTNKRQVLHGFRDCILPCRAMLVSPRNIKVYKTTKMHHRMLINIMGFNGSGVGFCEIGSRVITVPQVL